MKNRTLREICSETGVSRRAIQGYEKAGLVCAVSKNKYGYLLYDEAGLERIKRIKFFQQIGFSIKEIQQVIDAPAECQREAMLTRVILLNSRKEEITELISKINQYISIL